MELKLRLQAARAHYSHPSFLLGDWQPLGPQHPLLNDYLGSCVVTLGFAVALYFSMSALWYCVLYVWGKRKLTPRREELRVGREEYLHDIKWSLLNILGQVPLVGLIKLAYPYYSKVQYTFQFKPVFLLYLLLHICYDEFFTYWMHRLLHHPAVYRHLHAIHHRSRAVTPFTGFAFHPLDAFLQAVPVFTSCFFIPLPIDLVLAHGLLTSVWAISIHDNVNMVPFKGILYAGSHSIHHFAWGENYNYGKFTSVCDRLYGSYCDPDQITGYGFKTAPFLQRLCSWGNCLYTSLIPDLGLPTVSKIRDLYAKKLT